MTYAKTFFKGKILKVPIIDMPLIQVYTPFVGAAIVKIILDNLGDNFISSSISSLYNHGETKYICFLNQGDIVTYL